MAIFYPDKETLEKKEWALYNELKDLDNDFYVCYEPFQFMRKNLVLILREDVGLFILKITDEIDFSNYYKELKEYENDQIKKSRIKNTLSHQLRVDADYFFSDICPNAGIIKNNEKKAFGCVNVGYWLKNQENGIPQLQYIPIWGKSAKAGDIIKEITEKKLKPHNYNERKEITRLAQKLFFPIKSNLPSNGNYTNAIQNTEVSQKINFTPDQIYYIKNTGNGNKRISGSAGTGKTIIGVYRAIDRVINHKEHVLFLYYNITLKGYIENKIRSLAPQGSEGTSILSKILVTHLDGFKKRINIKKDSEKSIQTLQEPLKMCSFEEELLDNAFETIIVDETQDFATEDFTLIHGLFQKSEFLFLGDFSQNIYLRKWDDPLNKENNTVEVERTGKPALKGFGFTGRWKSLQTIFRSNENLNEVILDFCKKFEIEGPQGNKVDNTSNLPFYNSIKLYHDTSLCLDKKAENPIKLGKFIQSTVINDETINTVYDFIKMIMEDNSFSPKDTAILSSQRDTLRSLQKIYDNNNIKYESMVATNINPEEIKTQYTITDKNSYDKIVDSYDRIFKLAFDNNKDAIKFSTIYSYKGYEADNVIILLDTRIINDANADKQTQEEQWKEGRKKELALIYTAISRSRKNIVLIGFNDYCSNDIKEYFKNKYSYVF